jgi:UDP-N-acetylmuramate--alanine ligase
LLLGRDAGIIKAGMNLASVIQNRERVYFIGIKGTGTCALAELLHGAGARVSGSDTADVFYTDGILKALGIPCFEGFDAARVAQISGDCALVIHSAAYSAANNREMAEAERLGLPLVKYTDALGAYSALFDSSGIAGVHGKTTTAGLAGTLIAAAGLPAQVLAGSAVGTFGGRSTINAGNKYFVAETCEYRKHFLSFHPRRVVLTGVESDHQDFFPTYESIRDAFVEYGERLPRGGELIYCADDAGAREVASILRGKRPDIAFTPYGFGAAGCYKITSSRGESGASVFRLEGMESEWTLRIPGRHNVLNAAGAIALTKALADNEGIPFDAELAGKLSRALAGFSGSKRRAEIVGEAGGILFIDDYAHHPTAIRTTLAGFKDFYSGRRLVVSFMPHTYSRTAALFDEFTLAFSDADILFLHKIYASARELSDGFVTGRSLFEKTPHNAAHYFEEPLDAFDGVKTVLKPGDIFITMGAGDNWKLGVALLDYYKQKEAAS